MSKRNDIYRKIPVIVLVIAFMAVSIWAIYKDEREKELTMQLKNQYSRAFSDFSSYANDIEALLIKSTVVDSPNSLTNTLQQVWNQCTLAQSSINQLPIPVNLSVKMQKFFNQLGDISKSLNKSNISSNSIDRKEREKIENLQQYIVDLNEGIQGVREKLNSGELTWEQLEKDFVKYSSGESTGDEGMGYDSFEDTFTNYPTLIYDGAFSDHLASNDPKMLTGDEISQKQAEEKVRQFLSDKNIKSLKYDGETLGEVYRTYSFTVNTGKENIYLDVTKENGYIYSMISDRQVSKSNISMRQAKKNAKKFLKDRGYNNMKDSYYITEDNIATINYAYIQDDVIIYNDLIKVKVELETGEIIGFESKGYISAHHKRNISKPKIKPEEALSQVSRKVDVMSTGLAIIPTTYGTEVYTYEIKGKINNNEVLIYINAYTGEEESILIIVDTPNGVLTI